MLQSRQKVLLFYKRRIQYRFYFFLLSILISIIFLYIEFEHNLSIGVSFLFIPIFTGLGIVFTNLVYFLYSLRESVYFEELLIGPKYYLGLKNYYTYSGSELRIIKGRKAKERIINEMYINGFVLSYLLLIITVLYFYYTS